MDKNPGETLPLPVKSDEYKRVRSLLEKIIKKHRESLIKAKPDLNLCDPAVMNWAPPGCQQINKCLPVPKSNVTKCYWDH